MIDLNYINSFFPPQIAGNANFQKHILKEYVLRCGFFFSLPVPPDSVLLSMKLSALLSRAKGRDFYDTMFLMQQTKPSYEFLSVRVGINSPDELKKAILEKLKTTDLNIKKRDFEHLLFNSNAGEKILMFEEFINQNPLLQESSSLLWP
ncbi:MAG: hypothetical protein ACI3Y4_00870 [Candidatus Cryptobacteroides sp.]